jgi:hypothetical protein
VGGGGAGGTQLPAVFTGPWSGEGGPVSVGASEELDGGVRTRKKAGDRRAGDREAGNGGGRGWEWTQLPAILQAHGPAKVRCHTGRSGAGKSYAGSGKRKQGGVGRGTAILRPGHALPTERRARACRV